MRTFRFMKHIALIIVVVLPLSCNRPSSADSPEDTAVKGALDYALKGKSPISSYRKAADQITGKRAIDIDTSSPQATVLTAFMAVEQNNVDVYMQVHTNIYDDFNVSVAKQKLADYRTASKSAGKIVEACVVRFQVFSRPPINIDGTTRGALWINYAVLGAVSGNSYWSGKALLAPVPPDNWILVPPPWNQIL